MLIIRRSNSEEQQYKTPGVVADDVKITGVDSREDSESNPSNDYEPNITPITCHRADQ